MQDFITLPNGVMMPLLGYGTYLTPDGSVCEQGVAKAIEVGYRHIDTAAVYGNEKSVGRAIACADVPRSDLFVTSKLWNSERGYDSTLRAFDKTMADLGLEYLDLYLIHWPANAAVYADKADSLNVDTWRAFERLYADGRVRAIGLSNFMPHHATPIMDVASVMPMVNQIEFHPGFVQRECVEWCAERNIVVQAWSPLGRGAALTHPAVLAIAEEVGVTAAQVIIRWVMQRGVVPLVKSVHAERIAENFDVMGFSLSERQMEALNALTSERIGQDPDTFASWL